MLFGRSHLARLFGIALRRLSSGAEGPRTDALGILDAEVGAALQESGLSGAGGKWGIDHSVPSALQVKPVSKPAYVFRRETEMRAPITTWMCVERSPVLIADELDFRFGAPDLLAADAHGLVERIEMRIQPVLQLDQLALLGQLSLDSMTRAQIEALTSMRWRDYERRVLDRLRQDGLVAFDEATDRWCSGRSLAVPFAGLVAVEMKLRDDRRALAQAMRYRAFASESFVAMPQPRIDDSLIEACGSRGIGLLAVCATGASVIVDAIASEPLDPLLHRLAQEMLLARHFGQTTSAPAGSPRGLRPAGAVLA